MSIENTTTGKWYDGSGFNASTVQWLATGGTTAAWTYPLAASKLTDGSSYTVSSQATDAVGTTQSTPASTTFSYDTTAPTIALSALRHDYDGRADHVHGDLCRRKLQQQHVGGGQHHAEQDWDCQRHGGGERDGPDADGDDQRHHRGWQLGNLDCGGHGIRPGRQCRSGGRPHHDVHRGQHGPNHFDRQPLGLVCIGGPITYTVTYADANFNSSTLAAANITLNKTGTANGTVGVSGTGLTRTVTISGITGDGSLGISIVAGTASTWPAMSPRRPAPPRRSSWTTRPQPF